MDNKTLLSIVAAALVGVGVGVAVSHNDSNEATAKEAPAATQDASDQSTLGNKLVQVQSVELQTVQDQLIVNGKLAINGLKLHQVSARVAGRIDRINMVEGTYVQAGQPIAWLFSPEFISAQNEYLLARRAVKMLNTTATADLYEDAKATLEGAKTKLMIIGASTSDVAYLDQKGTAQEYLAITAPITGRVTKRDIDPGGYLDTGSSVGMVADMSELWFIGNAFEANLNRVHEGLVVDVLVPAIDPIKPMKGRISFVSPTLDPQTHTAAVRVDISNPKGMMRPEMFAKAQIDLGSRQLPVVPRVAVVQDGAESFVIVQRDKGFERISVVVAPANDADHLAILQGLQPTDKVVVEGSVLVDRDITNNTQSKPAASDQQVKP
jgi:membrane fusion protein, copper/silver efflux system